MSQNKTFFCRLISAISAVVLLPLIVLGNELHELPLGVQRLIYAEQVLLSRDLNQRAIISPKDNSQAEIYKPENRQIFSVKSYWIPQSKTHTFSSSRMNLNLQRTFLKKENGKNYVLMLVHPESERFFSEITQQAERGPDFRATATSSSRTLLMWQSQAPENAFFGKLSLDKEIAGAVRTIPGGEVARSVGVNEILESNRGTIPQDTQYMPETFSMIPKGIQRGGMIIREIPPDLASGKTHFIPLFSLYSERAGSAPLLAEMINRSQQDPNKFIQEKIIRPFVKQWLELNIKLGISMEPHAQNVLIGIDSNGIPNGTFMHRDFGGFNVNLDKQKNSKLNIPRALPQLTDANSDYHQKFHNKSIDQSIQTYFENGFIYNLDKKLPLWVQQGWISSYKGKHEHRRFTQMLYQILAEELASVSNNKISPSPLQLRDGKLHYWVEKARSQVNLYKFHQCSSIFL